ncbi:MAG: FHA domain-containing protein [Myxococcota bacterium]
MTKGPDAGLRFPIREGRVSVGRAPDMSMVLTDPTVRPRHFVVIFEEGGWKAITYEPDATILIDRRWEHPSTRQRGARIFVGDTQLLLFAGDIDLRTARTAGEGLDIDEETLRDEALTTVGDEAYQFRHDMRGKGQRTRDRLAPPPAQRATPGKVASREMPVAQRPSVTPPPAKPVAPLLSTGAETAGMARPPLEELRAKPPPPSEPPPSEPKRNSWDRAIAVPARDAKAKQLGLQIRLSDTAIAAMPSQSRDLWVLYEKDGPFAAELRILATRLDELRNTFGYRSFLFTSVNEGEGKTVTAANLALVMSEDPERRIALVDANFRGPRAAELFNLDRQRGLLAAISGQRSLSECVARVVGRNLIVLHAGGEHKNPAQVLSDPKFKTMLNELSQAVDFMIIDAPSALGHADVPLLAQHADAVFLVVGANHTRRADLDKAIDTIGRTRVVGTIFRPLAG